MATQTTNCITLQGSAQIIAEYLKYGINAIIFQRGIYPAETFESTQHYGITILMSKDPHIEQFLENVLSQSEVWIAKNLVDKFSLIITNAHTKEVLENWDFKVNAEPVVMTTVPSEGKKSEPIVTKDLKRIQSEIRDVMRQISATVSYLPLLDCVCTFDVLIHTVKDLALPELWDETQGVFIQNSQTVKLRSFSTGLHKVDTVVNYKCT